MVVLAILDHFGPVHLLTVPRPLLIELHQNYQEGKSSLKLKFLGRIFLGHQGPTRRDIPGPGPGMSRTKTLCKMPFSVVFDRDAIWVSMSRDRKNFM